ncbi:hypothetical protein RIF29_18774 [Crotalaria pallida]|uniref:Uncharacterized protein n=1 Tax=Crotalaria pallida TaxID=3830 RepID=A0AAN9F014_CROPI
MEPNTSASVHAPDHNMPQLQQAPPPQDSHLVPPTGIINVKPRRLPDLNASPPPDDDEEEEEVQDLRMHLLDKVSKTNKDPTASAIASDHNQPPILQQAPRPQVSPPCINVKSRLLIDINASPPRDDDDDEEEVQNLRYEKTQACIACSKI